MRKVWKGLRKDNLVREFKHNFGYYLHLHGSPLFIDNNNQIVKLQRDRLTLDSRIIGRHVVLTHVEHKSAVIARSYALSTYWDYLRFSLSEAKEIILFGYSGRDNHLNAMIKPYLSGKNIRVVEWSGAGEGEGQERNTYWESVLGKKPQLIQLDNILEFTKW